MAHPVNQDRENDRAGELNRVFGLIDEHFDATDFTVDERLIRFRVLKMKKPFRTVRKQFTEAGYYPFLRKRARHLVCILVRPRRGTNPPMKRENTIAITLFLVTIATTTMAGYYFSLPLVEAGRMQNIWWGCVSFSAALMIVLGCHEMGHKLTSMRYGIRATPPYFIPLPSFPMFGIYTLGTLGAIIKVQSPLPDDDAAVDMGLNGPIAGFVAALPITVLGFILSVRSTLPPALDFTFGKPLILNALSLLLAPVGEGHVVWHPTVYAGWVGFFITALNLIPVGQLDGGHVARALLGHKRFRTFSWAVIMALVLLGFFSYIWWVWAAIAALLTFRGYPRVMNEFAPLSAEKKRKAWIGLFLFILCFIPVPIRV